MSKLEEIAFNNLQFIVDREKFLSNRYKIENNQFSKEEDEEDKIYSFKELEYPIYFTFHQLMNHVHSSMKPTFHDKTKKQIIEMFEIAIDTINEYYVEIDNNNKSFERLLDDIDDKVSFIKDYYRYGWCLYLPTFMKDLFSKGCKLMIDSSRTIVKDYIDELKNPGGYDSDLSESDTDDTKDTDDMDDMDDTKDTKDTDDKLNLKED
jgi:hypothetical protein